MSRIRTIPHGEWSALVPSDHALIALERGEVLFFPRLAFTPDTTEGEIFSPAILSSSKNASFDPSSGRIGGTTLQGESLERLRALMNRFSESAVSLVNTLLPKYHAHIQRGRASFRPAEIAGRHSSWRKDDTRLHIDSFPATPVHGRRILRVFCNVNPEGKTRTWRVGGEFAEVVDRFGGRLRLPTPGVSFLLRALHVTKTRRSPYDALMLQLHDRMKADTVFQQTCEQETFAFPAGSSWMAFTDQVSHAAMAGQYQLEHTFLLPVPAMVDEAASPLRLLERLMHRRLAA